MKERHAQSNIIEERTMILSSANDALSSDILACANEGSASKLRSAAQASA